VREQPVVTCDSSTRRSVHRLVRRDFKSLNSQLRECCNIALQPLHVSQGCALPPRSSVWQAPVLATPRVQGRPAHRSTCTSRLARIPTDSGSLKIARGAHVGPSCGVQEPAARSHHGRYVCHGENACCPCLLCTLCQPVWHDLMRLRPAQSTEVWAGWLHCEATLRGRNTMQSGFDDGVQYVDELAVSVSWPVTRPDLSYLGCSRAATRPAPLAVHSTHAVSAANRYQHSQRSGTLLARSGL
jgi:hypothetical protein